MENQIDGNTMNPDMLVEVTTGLVYKKQKSFSSIFSSIFSFQNKDTT